MNVVNRAGPVLTPPALGHGPVPTEPYRSPAQFELEREHVFARTWLCVGRMEEIPQPGDFIVKEVEVRNTAALIVRGTDNRLRAFHNICAHRGNKLAWENRGRVKQFTCNYHAWTYTLDGELRGVTDAAMFFDLDKASCGLIPINIDCWKGFIFLNFAEKPEQSLKDYLGGLGEKLAAFPFEKYDACVEISGVYNGNWKIAVDAFQESYHLGYLHKGTIGPSFASGLNPSGRMITAEFFGPHHCGSIWGNRDAKPRPIEMTAFAFSALMVAGNKNDGQAGEDELPDTINPAKDPNWAIEMNVIFPSTIVFVNKQGYMVHSGHPISHDRTRWTVQQYFKPARTARQLFAQQLQLSLSRDTFVEDAMPIDRAQEALKSGVLKAFQFQDNEAFPRHLYNVVQDYIRKGVAASKS